MQAVIGLEIDIAVLFILAAPVWIAAAYLALKWPTKSFSLLWLFGLITAVAVGLGIALAPFHVLESNGFNVI